MVERRQVPRYQAELKGQVSQPAGGPTIDATVVTLSVAGCCLEGAASLQAKQDCEIIIAWEGREFRAEASVTWKSSKGEAGLKFLYIDQVNQELLRKICANLRLQPMAKVPEEPEKPPLV
ncbi:MAG: PilZ domain-containing protein [Acidobacteriia bacterium]|nr:PilZ domain-containing protein [Terriglobia bacterium]